MMHFARGGSGEQDQKIVATGWKTGDELFIKGTLPELGRYTFAPWMPSNALANLLGVDINNPEMEEFPESIKGDTGMLLRIIFTAFQKVRKVVPGMT
jgi:hypothetical protein